MTFETTSILKIKKSYSFSIMIDKNQYIEIFYKYRRKLCNFLFYKCGDMGYAEDLVQEVFVILWEKREKIKSGNLKSFLYTVSNNLFIDHYRRKNAEINLDLKYNISINTSESPEYLFEVEEFNQKLQKAINDLSEKERVVFLMNRIDGYTMKEIAECLDISIKAVEKRMHNTLEKIHKTIQHKI